MILISILSIAILAVGVVVGLLVGWVWRHRRVPNNNREPQFELEKLINCGSCGSLIPEGARRCAFCGGWQRYSPEDK
jgi:hypothetical protein